MRLQVLASDAWLERLAGPPVDLAGIAAAALSGTLPPLAMHGAAAAQEAPSTSPADVLQGALPELDFLGTNPAASQPAEDAVSLIPSAVARLGPLLDEPATDPALDAVAAGAASREVDGASSAADGAAVLRAEAAGPGRGDMVGTAMEVDAGDQDPLEGLLPPLPPPAAHAVRVCAQVV